MSSRGGRGSSDASPALRGGLAPWQTKRVAAYIEANIDSSFRVADLAPVLGLSATQFFRAFRKSFGETPLVYVTRQRMRRAQLMMLSSSEPLSQIALECGMCDQAHFTRVFRKLMGINPSVWRARFSPGASGRTVKGRGDAFPRHSARAFRTIEVLDAAFE